MIGSGVAAQLAAFRAGFEEVFPMKHLKVFTAEELGACVEPPLTLHRTPYTLHLKVSTAEEHGLCFGFRERQLGASAPACASNLI